MPYTSLSLLVSLDRARPGDGKDQKLRKIGCLKPTAPRENVGGCIQRYCVGLFGICSADACSWGQQSVLPPSVPRSHLLSDFIFSPHLSFRAWSDCSEFHTFVPRLLSCSPAAGAAGLRLDRRRHSAAWTGGGTPRPGPVAAAPRGLDQRRRSLPGSVVAALRGLDRRRHFAAWTGGDTLRPGPAAASPRSPLGFTAGSPVLAFRIVGQP